MYRYILLIVVIVIAYLVRVRLHNVGDNGYGSATTAEEVSEKVRLDNKVIIVTGGNNGIGFDTARVLALRGAKVILLARSLQKAENAIKEIKKQHPTINLDLVPMAMNLEDLSSIKKFASDFLSLKLPLHVLILNAGVMALPERTLTANGFEEQIGVNHLGHYYLSLLLLKKLEESAPSRVISLTSNGHFFSDGSFVFHPSLEQVPYDPWVAYGNSKLANILFAKEFDKLYHSRGITAVSVHPGGINTGLQKHMEYGWTLSGIIKAFIALAGPLVFKSISQGAATTVYCATSPDVDKLGGRYFEDAHVSVTSLENIVQNATYTEVLWKTSHKLIEERISFDISK